MDFALRHDSAELIAFQKPVCYFEYDTGLNEQAGEDARRTIRLLLDCGYTDYLLYDNFGRYLGRIRADHERRFREFDHYLALLRTFAPPGIQYYDICAVHETDAGICDRMETVEGSRTAS